jgi:hypothetical protein
MRSREEAGVKHICAHLIRRNYLFKICFALLVYGIGAWQLSGVYGRWRRMWDLSPNADSAPLSFLVYLGNDEHFTSGPLLLPFFPLVSGICVVCLVFLWSNPSKTAFGKNILRQSPQGSDLRTLFAEIDADVAGPHTKRYGRLYIGEKWIVGQRGMYGGSAVIRRADICGVFYVYKQEGAIRVYDRARDGYLFTAAYVRKKSQLDVYYLLIGAAPPGVLRGDAEAEAGMAALSEEEWRNYLRDLDAWCAGKAAEDVRRVWQDFRLDGSRILPTSRLDARVLAEAVANLAPGDFVRLAPLEPQDGGKGKLLELRCEPDGDNPARRAVSALFAENGETRRSSAVLDLEEAQLVFARLYTEGEIPDFDA